MEQNRETLHGLFNFDKRFLITIQKFYQPNKYSIISISFSMLRLRKLKFGDCHFSHCLVQEREQSRQGHQNFHQLEQVFEDTTFIVVFEKLIATGCLCWALPTELHTHQNFRIFLIITLFAVEYWVLLLIWFTFVFAWSSLGLSCHHGYLSFDESFIFLFKNADNVTCIFLYNAIEYSL